MLWALERSLWIYFSNPAVFIMLKIIGCAVFFCGIFPPHSFFDPRRWVKRKSISSSPLPSLFNKKIEGKRKKKKWGYFKKSAVGYWPKKSNFSSFSSLPLSGRKEKMKKPPPSHFLLRFWKRGWKRKRGRMRYFLFRFLTRRKNGNEKKWILSFVPYFWSGK